MSLTAVTKSDFRRSLLVKRRALTLDESICGSLQRNIFALLKLLKPKTLGSYIPIMGEPDITKALQQWSYLNQVNLYLPETIPNGIRYRSWHEGCTMCKDEAGVLYPVGDVLNDAPEVILVPCLGHDCYGRRLGYGKGYFDRYLSTISDGTAIGISFEELEIPSCIFESHDLPMQYIVTESRLITV